MSGKIGARVVNILPGSRMRGPVRLVTRRNTRGVNGAQVIRGAYDQPPSTYFTEATAADERAALLLMNSYELLVGESVAVIDETGIVHADVVVLAVDATHDTFALAVGADSPADTYLVRASWLFQSPFSLTRQGGVSQ